MIMPEAAEAIERLQGHGGELQLQRRGRHFEIIYNGTFLMATYNGASERAMVEEAVCRLSGCFPQLRLLLGGLGVGFSLAAALRFDAVKEVTVVELEPAVIRWNRDYLPAFNGHALEDPRVRVVTGDFMRFILDAPASSYHLAVVDTDNGGSWLCRAENAAIYGLRGVQRLCRCLVPGGAAVFWCCRPEPELEQVLGKLFRSCSCRMVREATGQEAGYYLAYAPKCGGKSGKKGSLSSPVMQPGGNCN